MHGGIGQERVCLVIAPIGEPGSETRQRSDELLEHVIRPATKRCGYSAIRADEIAGSGMITSQVVQHLLNAPLVVADLTDHNANVFYELAIRHAAHRPVVQIIKKGQPIPFDVHGMRTIHVEQSFRGGIAAMEEIERCIRAIEANPGAATESPVPRSLLTHDALRDNTSFEALKRHRAVSVFRIPEDNQSRDRRTRELLARRRQPHLRLAASSGRSYLADSGAAWLNGVGAAVTKDRCPLQVILASPLGTFAKARARANNTDLHLWQERVSVPKLRDLCEKHDVKVNVTEHPLNCSLFFVGDSVLYDPYLWSRPTEDATTENNFWVFEFEKTEKEDPTGCYSLLDGHFKFLLKESIPLDDFIQQNPKAFRTGSKPRARVR